MNHLSYVVVCCVYLFLAACGNEVSIADGAPANIKGPLVSTGKSTPPRDDSVSEGVEVDVNTHEHKSHQGDPNRLANESSPYLLQHARNPVDWYPWGEEAFAVARERQVPIFLSIGYSTCYWCHVMERESFENPDVAAIMNRDFVCIKVDREQRPDVDEIYMTACQVFTRLTTGRASGGWPLSIFLDPDSLEPFLAGTYYPPVDSYGKPSFTRLMGDISNAWSSTPEEVREQGKRIAALVEEELATRPGVAALNTKLADRSVASLESYHDQENGGFGGAPKFPQPTYVELMIDGGWDRPGVRDAVVRTLDAMAIGGIYDHIGGGFHRYAVDADWTVPHFEKMLYDNGQLASLYARVYELTKDEFYAEVVRGTLDYVLREMVDEGGAFLSAQDAEVNTREGESYIWRRKELQAALESVGREDDVEFVFDVYGLNGTPNFQDPHHQEDAPSNVLRFDARPEKIAQRLEMSRADFVARLAAINADLLQVRNTRDQPMTDDKILASWNGLMIKGMADGGRILNEPRYVEAAVAAAESVLLRLGNENGGLYRTARGDVVQVDAFLEDYAMLAEAFLALDDATDDPRWREAAERMAAEAKSRFWNDLNGGWFDTQANQSDLFVRSSSQGDGAVPSGSSTMLMVLVQLAERTGKESYVTDATSAFRAISSSLAGNAVGMSKSMRALIAAAKEMPEVLPSVAQAPPPENPVRVRVMAGEGEGNWMLRFTITPDLHINAHDPGDPSLVGLNVLAISGGEIEINWPKGEAYRDEIMIHRGILDLPFSVVRESPQSTVMLKVIWQACTDSVCLRPEQFDVEIPPR